MKSSEELRNLCIDKLHENGHELFGCHCGRIHVDPMGFVNPKGWTPKELLIIYGSAVVGAILLVSAIMYFAGC